MQFYKEASYEPTQSRNRQFYNPQYNPTLSDGHVAEPASEKKSYNLGKGRLLEYNEWKGESRLDLRVWENKFPTKNGVVLPLKRYLVLRRLMSNITTALEDVCSSKQVNLKIHLGGNVHVTVNSPYACVNIRKWYTDKRDDVVKPGKGLSLHPAQWRELCFVDSKLDRDIPALKDTVECMQQGDHQNLLGALECPECCPEGYII